MTWRVYGLIDSRDGSVFYIGLSSRISERRNQHRTDRGSAAWQRFNEVEGAGSTVEVCIFGSFEDKTTAKVLEGRLILAIPDIVNKKSYHGLPSSYGLPNWQDLRISVA